METVAFLTDITSHLNGLNLKLQGKNSTVCGLMTEVRAFQGKLELYKSDIQEGMLHFSKLLEQTKGKEDHRCRVEFLERLIENFKTCFENFELGEQLQLFTDNPFLVKNVRGFAEEAQKTYPWARAAPLQSELIHLQENIALKEAQCDAITLWTKMVTAANYPLLYKIAVHILTMFGSTYSCESAFSTMNIVENKYCTRLTNKHFRVCFRLAITPLVPRFKVLAAKPRCHFFH
ncbi:general transcription factor II-I repeat domain-containing protein 2-like [Xyrichtys novacula]|uniref:General transcription factor II-I repeat domain-containing protein 2-like n=1 Tax=Xyrichtys novacula TaxID=13765 RepID=A0AAV1FAR9_XYRNO|nr:general transcription factor II-I repeat domain-containing protein 2-like [Xyrichtys novacula]